MVGYELNGSNITIGIVGGIDDIVESTPTQEGGGGSLVIDFGGSVVIWDPVNGLKLISNKKIEIESDFVNVVKNGVDLIDTLKTIETENLKVLEELLLSTSTTFDITPYKNAVNDLNTFN